MTTGSQLNNGMMRLTQRGVESMSQNSKSMSKICDNDSQGSYKTVNKEKKFRSTKQGALMHQTNSGLTDLKIDNSKTQTFNSDVEENYVNQMGPPALPPIFMPQRKGNKKKNVPNNTSLHNAALSTFNQTKKNFP